MLLPTKGEIMKKETKLTKEIITLITEKGGDVYNNIFSLMWNDETSTIYDLECLQHLNFLESDIYDNNLLEFEEKIMFLDFLSENTFHEKFNFDYKRYEKFKNKKDVE